jgi:hypothetical protein
MTQPQPSQKGAQASTRRWQYSLRDMLAVMLALSVLLGAWRGFGGGVGAGELGLLIIAGTSLLLSGTFKRIRWPWFLGLVLCFLAVWFLLLFTPPVRLLKYMIAGSVSGVYVAAGLPVLICFLHACCSCLEEVETGSLGDWASPFGRWHRGRHWRLPPGNSDGDQWTRCAEAR